MRPSHAVIALLIATVLRANAPPTATGGVPTGARPGGIGSLATYCPGEYADEISALSPKAREFEQRQPPYTYCIRTAATYECPSYGADGALRRVRRKVLAHGTGFGYRQSGGETLVVTNQHVAEWPAVTDDDHKVEDVPPGCRRVADSLKIVDSERDAYERDDVPLTRAVSDPRLDVAVLRAKAKLPVLPWKIGRSAALRERNAVDVRGFPLGVLRANNVGKVISAYDHDEDREWNHDDFVIDALLSQGNSGSPVFAISCRTGEFELVGVYHAGYAKGSALNVVVGIDQLRDLLTTLKRAPRPQGDGLVTLDREDRAKVLDGLRAEAEPFFPLGSFVAKAQARPDGGLLFELMGKDFPVQVHPVLVLEDLPGAEGGGFGELGRVWAGNRQGLREVDRADLDADALSQTAKLLDAFRSDALMAVAYRAAARAGMDSRARFQEISRMERTLRRMTAAQSDLAQAAVEMADRLCPATADAPLTVDAALAIPGPASAQGGGAQQGAATPAAEGHASPVAGGGGPAAAPLAR